MHDLSTLKGIAEQIAPELTGRLALFVRERNWPFPAGVLAIYAFDAPPWAREKGATADCIIFANRAAATIEVLLHELSHALPLHPKAPASTRPVSPEEARYLVAWSVGPPAPGLSFGDLPPWIGHEDKFIRRLLHLVHRAERLGHSVRLRRTFGDTSAYGLRSICAYQAALADEPARSVGKSFWEIEQTDPPAKFTRFFKEDTERYWGWKSPRKETCE